MTPSQLHHKKLMAPGRDMHAMAGSCQLRHSSTRRKRGGMGRMGRIIMQGGEEEKEKKGARRGLEQKHITPHSHTQIST
jgi:hypothetical protein